jgi:hypothetical protein
MKKPIHLFSLFAFGLLMSFILISCSKQDEPIANSPQFLGNATKTGQEAGNPNGRTAGTECRINNILGTTANAQPGTIVSYTYSNSLGSVPSIVWSLSNVVPARSVTWVSGNRGTTISLTFGSNFVSCTLNVTGSGTPPSNNFDCNTYLNISAIGGGGSGGSTCSVNGTSLINPCLGNQTYTYINSSSPIQNVSWSLVNVVPPGSVTLVSGSGISTSLSFSPYFQSATLQAVGMANGNQCAASLNLTLAAPSCAARVVNIWCSPGSEGYNVMINASVAVGNPFCNNASVLIQWDPANFSGSLVAGGEYSLGPYATATYPTQFNINANTSLPAGFYVPMIAKYTDLVTGQTCTAKLNPLVTGGCNGSPM